MAMMGDSKDKAFAAADGGRANVRVNAVVSRGSGSRLAKMALAGTMLLLSGGNGVLCYTTNETCAKKNEMRKCVVALPECCNCSLSSQAVRLGLDANLVKFRDAMFARPQSNNWRNALASWTCPTDPANSDIECDPCGSNTPWGNWDHIGCLGDPLPGESFRFEVPGDGIVTNMHITDYKIEGAVPIKELCNFPQLREFDVDGGWLEGPIPGGFGTCFKDLEEIDLSYNNLSGPLPPEIADNPSLRHFKVEVNQAVSGGIPPEYGSMESLQWLRLGVNKMSGEIPKELSKTSARLHHMTMDQNDFEGNLYPFKDHKFVNFLAQNNPKLCGMVPLGVRYAHGFNYYNTKLGLPCPEEAGDEA